MFFINIILILSIYYLFYSTNSHNVPDCQNCLPLLGQQSVWVKFYAGTREGSGQLS